MLTKEVINRSFWALPKGSRPTLPASIVNEMKKKIIIISIIVLTTGAAVFGYWTISPLFIDVQVSEEMLSEPVVLTQGEFAGIAGHSASGIAKLLDVTGKKYVRFEENFKVTNGPDLFVYLGKDGQYDPGANLGRLKGNIGSQNYEVPAGIDLSKYDSVWVWCRVFSVGFGVASLQ